MRASDRPSAVLPDRCFAMLLDAVPHTCFYVQMGSTMESKWVPNGLSGFLEPLGLLQASWSGPGASWSALEASGAEIKKLGTAPKGCQNGSQNGSQKRSKMLSLAQEAPRGCQGAISDQFWSKLGSILTRFGDVFCIILGSLQISEVVFWNGIQ